MNDPLLRARAGDADAFVHLVRGQDARLRRLAFRILGDRDRTDDVLQEAYLRAFRSLGTFRGGSELGSWLYRITYNCCIDEIRASGRRPRPVEDLPEVQAPGSEPGGKVAVQEAVRDALQALPVDQRAAVLLVDGGELDYSGAAEVLGVPRGTVASRVARARHALRVSLALEKESFDER